MKGGDNVYQRGIYAATKALLKGMGEPDDVEAELVRMSSFSVIYASILDPSLEQMPSIGKRLVTLKASTWALRIRCFCACSRLGARIRSASMILKIA
jgi:hypothetical protein